MTTNKVIQADIVNNETDGENAAILVNDSKRAINEVIDITDALGTASQADIGAGDNDIPVNSDLEGFITGTIGRTQQQRLGIYHGSAVSNGTLPSGWRLTSTATSLTVVHNIGTTSYTLVIPDYSPANPITNVSKGVNSFTVNRQNPGSPPPFEFSLLMT